MVRLVLSTNSVGSFLIHYYFFHLFSVFSSTRMKSITYVSVWFVLFCLVHIHLLAFVDIGIRPLSLMRYSRNFPLQLVCCVHWGWLMPIFTLKSPVRIIPPFCFSLLICVLSSFISRSTVSAGVFSCLP